MLRSLDEANVAILARTYREAKPISTVKKEIATALALAALEDPIHKHAWMPSTLKRQPEPGCAQQAGRSCWKNPRWQFR